MNLAEYYNSIYLKLGMRDTNRFSLASVNQCIYEAETYLNSIVPTIKGQGDIAPTDATINYAYPSDILDNKVEKIYYLKSSTEVQQLLDPDNLHHINDAIEKEWIEEIGTPRRWYHLDNFTGFGLFPHESTVDATSNISVIYKKKITRMTRYYATGTVAITNGSTAVTGTSTSFTGNVSAGDYIGIGSLLSDTTSFPLIWHEIKTVGGATSLTLETAFSQATVSGASYIIAQASSIDDEIMNLACCTYSAGLLCYINKSKEEGDALVGFALKQADKRKTVLQNQAVNSMPLVPAGMAPRRFYGSTGYDFKGFGYKI